MNVRKSLCVTIIALAVTMIAFGAGVEARYSKSMLLPYDATVAGSHLTGGNYDIKWATHSPAATVTFVRKSKVVATAEGTVVDCGTRYPSNGVVYTVSDDGSRLLRELRFKDSSEVIVFNQ
jgi:hypothetical protein